MPELKEKIGTKQLATATVVKAKELGEGQLDVIVATEDRDRMEEILSIKGLDVSAYKKNPVVLWAHQYGAPMIGKAIALKKTQDGQLQARVQFAINEYDFAHTIYKLYKGGYAKAFSIGFIPLDVDTETWTWTKSEMLEFSAVPVPANPNALTLEKAFKDGAISKGEKAMVEDVVKGKAQADKVEFEDYEDDDQTEATEAEADDTTTNSEPAETDDSKTDTETNGEEEAPADEAVSDDDAKTKGADSDKVLTVGQMEQYLNGTTAFIKEAMDAIEKLVKENVKDSGQGRAATAKRRVRLVKARSILQLVDKAGESANREIKSTVNKKVRIVPKKKAHNAKKIKFVTKKESHA